MYPPVKPIAASSMFYGQRELQNPPPPLTIQAFSERRLRMLLAQSDNAGRLRDWQIWGDELRSSANS